MFTISLEPRHGILSFVLGGRVDAREMREFAFRLRAATVTLVPGRINVLADLRGLVGDGVAHAEVIVALQSFGLALGVRRVAELVSAEQLAKTLDQAAHSSGTDRVLRRFDDPAAARAWLVDDDGPERAAPPGARSPRQGSARRAARRNV